MTEETVAQETKATQATPAVDFKTYLSVLPEPDREIYTKNGVDSFEKQTAWVKGLNELRGKKGIIPPGADATPEQKKAYKESLYKELGRPDDGKYEFELPEGSKDEHYSPEVLNKLATVAFDNGISQQGFQQIINAIAEPYNAMLKTWETKMAEIQEKLGEGKIDDESTNSETTKSDLHEMAKAKRIEAEELHRKGDFAAAMRLKKEADELYSKLASAA